MDEIVGGSGMYWPLGAASLRLAACSTNFSDRS
jgi:hypothetical protein